MTATVGMAFAGSAYYRQSHLSDAPDVASRPGEVDRTMAAAVLAAELPIAESTYAWHYEYDALSRVTLACSNGWDDVAKTCAGDEFQYEYDGGGNLLRFDKWNADTNQVETVRYVINGANQITCIDLDASGTCNASETLWEYDRYGNVLNDGANTYVYDTANRLSAVTVDSVTTIYTYNGDGDRVSQTVDAVTTTYLLDTATPLTMVLSETTGTETITYWHALDTLAQSDGTTTEYFSYDGLGSVRQLVDGSGSVTLAQTFDPYGSGYATSGSASSSLGWTGEQIDGNGFVYLRARYYQPGMGRFTQMDPSRLERNGYQYGSSNPVNRVDPSGLCANCRSASPTDIPEVAGLLSRIGAAIDCNKQYIQQPETCCGPDATDWFMRTVNSGLQYHGGGDVPSDALDLADQLLTYLEAIYRMPGGSTIHRVDFLSRLTRFMTYGLAVRFVNIDYYSMASPSANFLSTPDDKPEMVTLCGECMRSDDFGNFMFGIGGHNMGIPFDIVTALTMGFNARSGDLAGANPLGSEVGGVWAGYTYASLFGPTSSTSDFCANIKKISIFSWHDSRDWPPSTVQAKTPCQTCSLNKAPIPNTYWNGYVFASPVTARRQWDYSTPLEEFIDTVSTRFKR